MVVLSPEDEEAKQLLILSEAKSLHRCLQKVGNPDCYRAGQCAKRKVISKKLDFAGLDSARVLQFEIQPSY